MAARKKQQSQEKTIEELEEDKQDLLNKCNQIFAKIRQDFKMKFPTDQYIKFDRQYANHMKKEFDLFSLCVEEVSQTYEIDGDKILSSFLNNVLITIKVMLFTQVRCFLNYLDQTIQFNDSKPLKNWEITEIQKLSRHRVKIVRGTVDEDVIKAQEKNLVNDPSDEIKKKLGVSLDPLLREHQMTKQELVETLEEKRRNLTLKESKAGRYLFRQIEGIKQTVQKEKAFVTEFEEKHLEAIKKLVFSDGVTQVQGILDQITDNLDGNAKKKLVKVLEYLFENAKNMFAKKNVSCQTAIVGQTIDGYETQITKLNRQIYDSDKNINQVLKDTLQKDYKITELEKQVQFLKQTANKEINHDDPQLFFMQKIEDLNKTIEKLNTQIININVDKQYYQNQISMLQKQQDDILPQQEINKISPNKKGNNNNNNNSSSKNKSNKKIDDKKNNVKSKQNKNSSSYTELNNQQNSKVEFNDIDRDSQIIEQDNENSINTNNNFKSSLILGSITDTNNQNFIQSPTQKNQYNNNYSNNLSSPSNNNLGQNIKITTTNEIENNNNNNYSQTKNNNKNINSNEQLLLTKESNNINKTTSYSEVNSSNKNQIGQFNGQNNNLNIINEYSQINSNNLKNDGKYSNSFQNNNSNNNNNGINNYTDQQDSNLQTHSNNKGKDIHNNNNNKKSKSNLNSNKVSQNNSQTNSNKNITKQNEQNQEQSKNLINSSIQSKQQSKNHSIFEESQHPQNISISIQNEQILDQDIKSFSTLNINQGEYKINENNNHSNGIPSNLQSNTSIAQTNSEFVHHQNNNNNNKHKKQSKTKKDSNKSQVVYSQISNSQQQTKQFTDQTLQFPSNSKLKSEQDINSQIILDQIQNQNVKNYYNNDRNNQTNQQLGSQVTYNSLMPTKDSELISQNTIPQNQNGQDEQNTIYQEKTKSKLDLNDILDALDLNQEEEEKNHSAKILEVLTNKENPKRREIINSIVNILNNANQSIEGQEQQKTGQYLKKSDSYHGFSSDQGQTQYKKTQTSLTSTPYSTAQKYMNNSKNNNNTDLSLNQSSSNKNIENGLDQDKKQYFKSNRNNQGINKKSLDLKHGLLEKIDQNLNESLLNTSTHGRRPNHISQSQTDILSDGKQKKYATQVTFKDFQVKPTSEDHLGRIVQNQEIAQDIIRKKNQMAMSRFQGSDSNIGSYRDSSLNNNDQQLSKNQKLKNLSNADPKRGAYQNVWRGKDEFRLHDPKSSLQFIPNSTHVQSAHNIQGYDQNKKNVSNKYLSATQKPQIKPHIPFNENEKFTQDLYSHIKQGKIDFNKLKDLEMKIQSQTNIFNNEYNNSSGENKKQLDNNIGYNEFNEYYAQLIQQHRRCGPMCIHLKRFYEKLDFNIKQYERRQMITCPTLVVQEIPKESKKDKSKFNLQNYTVYPSSCSKL